MSVVKGKRQHALQAIVVFDEDIKAVKNRELVYIKDTKHLMEEIARCQKNYSDIIRESIEASKVIFVQSEKPVVGVIEGISAQLRTLSQLAAMPAPEFLTVPVSVYWSIERKRQLDLLNKNKELIFTEARAIIDLAHTIRRQENNLLVGAQGIENVLRESLDIEARRSQMSRKMENAAKNKLQWAVKQRRNQQHLNDICEEYNRQLGAAKRLHKAEEAKFSAIVKESAAKVRQSMEKIFNSLKFLNQELMPGEMRQEAIN